MSKENALTRTAGFVLALNLMLGAVLVPAAEGQDASARSFGAPIRLETETPLAQVLAHPERYAEGPVLIRGRITDVCQRKGCWTVVADGEATLRIRFKDYGFFVPKDIRGQFALAEGEVRVETQTQEMARHFASESSGADPAAIVGPQRVVAFTATGLRLVESER